MHDDDPDDLPWTEEQWEKLMRESDVRSAKFGELLETLGDHPDAEAIIAREMGWDRPAAGEENEEDEEPFAVEEPSFDEIDQKEWEEQVREEEAELKAMPAYARSYQLGLEVWKALKPLMKDEEDQEDDDLIQAFSNCHLIAAKIAGAHGMGYEDEVLCGNIVNCKIALTAAKDCLEALEQLRAREVLPGETLPQLIAESREVQRLIEQHIAELRSRVWWQ